MSEVLRALEGPIAPMFCATDDPEHAVLCDRSAECTVNVLWVRVRDAITGALDSMTLADLVPPIVHADPAIQPEPEPQGAPDPAVTDQPATDQHLVIRGLRVAPIADPEHEILQGIDLTVGKGEVHAIMGPNGSGKTTLAYALLGHPAYKVTGGEVIWKGRDILALSPGQARPARPVPGLPVPDRDPRPERRLASSGRALNAKLQGIDKDPDVDPTDPMQAAASRCATSATRCARRWRCCGWTRASPADTSTTASRAARRSASRCSRWPSSSRRWRSSTRPTRASTSTRCGSSPRASTRCSTRTSASCSSPTTSACSTTSSPTWSTSSPRAGSSRPAARTWPCGSRTRATARSSARPASRPTSRRGAPRPQGPRARSRRARGGRPLAGRRR